MKKVAIYVRVSTQEQATEGYSIPEQTSRLTKYCEAHDWIIVQTYTDPGFSGSNTDRPALQKLFSDAAQHSFDTVLVYKLDRLSRSQKDTLYIIEDVFLKNNIDFISMNENFDTGTPFGRAMIGILSVFAQLEREQIKERLMMGRVGRAKTGRWNGGSRPPVGYEYKDGELKIIEYEAMQIRLVFDLFLHGLNGEQLSMNAIREYMHERYTTRYSAWAKYSCIGLILQNKLYVGMIKYGGEWYPGAHEPIIDLETFAAVQEKYQSYIKTFGKSQRKPFQGTTLLSGLLYCSHCGARYYLQCATRMRSNGNKVSYKSYRCYSKSGQKKMIRDTSCPSRGWKMDELNNLVIQEIKKLSLDPRAIDCLYESSLGKSDNDDSQIIDRRLAEIDRQIDKLLDLYQLGTLDMAKLSFRMESLNSEKTALEKELECSKKPHPALSPNEAKAIVSDAASIFQNGTPEAQQALVRSLITKIVIYDEKLEFHWSFCIPKPVT